MFAKCPTCGCVVWTSHHPKPGVLVLVKCAQCREQEERQQSGEKTTKRPKDEA